MKDDNRLPIWVLIIGILLITGLFAYAIVAIINRGVMQTEQAVQPVKDVASDFATQVAEFLHPTPTILPDPVTIIHRVSALARLETIQYSVEKVITAETGQGPFGFLFGDRLLLVAHGVVIAGVDLAKVQSSDLQVRDGVLYMHLPEAEVFIATLDNAQTYVYDRDTGVLTKGNINLETLARQAAEVEILEAALQDGILEQARQNAENLLSPLLRDLGFAEVVFIWATPQAPSSDD